MLGNRHTAAAYLAGIIDGEGCIYLHNRKRTATRALTVVNTDVSILDATQQAYDTLGIFYTVNTLNYRSRQEAGKRRGWRIRVHHREGFLAAYRELPLQSESKRKKLRQILKSYRREPIRRLPARTRVARNVLSSRETAAAYLAAIIDGEGHVSQRRVCVTNTDDSILDTVKACYDKLGIGPYYVYNSGAPVGGNYEVKRLLVMQRQALQRIGQLVPLQCQYKLAELSRITPL